MNEKQRIMENLKGEIPKGSKTRITITATKKPDVILDACKKSLNAFLENYDLPEDDPEWQNILPVEITAQVDGLKENDFDDDFIVPLNLWVSSMKNPNIKKWEWYSSKLDSNGFEIITTGSATIPLFFLIHLQGIALANIRVDDDQFGNYKLYTLKEFNSDRK